MNLKTNEVNSNSFHGGNSPWVGLDCNSKVIVPLLEFNTTCPTIVLNETTTSDKYSSINEYSKLSTYSSNTINKNVSTTLISVEVEYFENEKTIEFAGQKFNMKPSPINL
ncbi:hypothetical protein ACTFIZ_009013 [Dictyostelium cf. discoideum]